MTALVVVLVVFVFLLGAAIGSFLNVVIYRVPLGLSIVRPGSRCPACDAPVRVVHNLPIAGWLLLRGRCARCGVQISARYPLIELAMGLLAVAVFASFAAGHLSEASLRSGRALFEVGIPTLLYGGFAALMLALAFIDLDWFVLPDGMTLPAIPLGVLTAWAAGGAAGVTVYDALIGAGVGAGVFLVIGLTYGLLTGRMGLGGGDWKLLAAIGAFLGWSALPFVLAAGAVQGLVFAVAFRRSFAVALLPPDPRDVLDAGDPAHAPIATEAGAGDALAAPEIPAPEPADAADVPFRQLAVPFGPFLGLAAIEMLLFRDELPGAPRAAPRQERVVAPPNVVTLVGQMGVGKSTVARALAARWSAHGHRAVDLDRVIEDRAGKPIPAIFADDGEAAFRALEAAALADVLAAGPIVLSTGGGTPCAPGAMDAILAAGPAVWLIAPAEVLAARALRSGTRPLLAGLDPAGAARYLEAQREERAPHYARANLHVAADRPPGRVAADIARLLSEPKK